MSLRHLFLALAAPTALAVVSPAQQPAAEHPAAGVIAPAHPNTTDEGPLITVRQSGNQLVADIPSRTFGQDFQVKASATERVSGGSLFKDLTPNGTSTYLRWVRRGDSLELLAYKGWAKGEAQYVRRGIYAILPRQGDAGSDSTARVDATGLFGLVRGVPPFVDQMQYSGNKANVTWTIQQVTMNPGNMAVDLTHHAEGSRSYDVKSSWVFSRPKIPTRPMFPRFHDPHISYWEADGTAVGEHPGYVRRWRLEKKDPSAPVSDVVRPIVYRIDKSVPRIWVPWIKRGIEDWLPAFEAIGFRHALVVYDGGTPAADDPNAPECLIRWSDGYISGAMTGVGGEDMRSGEILECSMTLSKGTIGLMQQYGFLYLDGIDPNLRYPYADSVSGRLLRLAVSHETGHTLGMEEQPKAGSSYPTDSLKSATFLHRMGNTPSIMSYSFFDAVALPEDHIPTAALTAHVGVYDRWALSWVYKPIPGVGSPEEEAAVLKQWRSAQDTALYLMAHAGDAGDRLYTIGNDLVESAEYISRNLARTVPLIDAQHDTSHIEVEPLAPTLRGDALELWGIAVSSAENVLGDVVPHDSFAHGPKTAQPAPVDPARQAEALRFGLAHVFFGQDPLVRALFRRPAGDSSLMLFDTAPAGWTVAQWQEMQRTLASVFVGRITEVAGQDPTTHLLPAVCAEVVKLGTALEKAAANAPRAEARSQATALQQIIRGPLSPQNGACRSASPAEGPPPAAPAAVTAPAASP